MNKVKQQEWINEHYARLKLDLIKRKFLIADENGILQLTEKGKQRAADRLDRLPTEDEILIQVAILNEAGLNVQL